MSEVKVDTISERTAAGGVTIDGVLVKDGVATFQTAAGSPLVFEGATANAFETTFAITDPTADRTITFPDSSFTVPTTGGMVLQVLEDNITGVVSTTSASYVTSGLSIDITPASTSSRFVLSLSGGEGANYNNNVGQQVTFYVDGSEVSDAGPYESIEFYFGDNAGVSHSACCVHSPATVSATTYAVFFKCDGGGTSYFNGSSGTGPGRVVFTVTELSS